MAGLSAALILGRCKRKVLVCDSGQPRNRASGSMHAFLSRDGVSPSEFLAISRNQLLAYPNVSLRLGTVTSINPLGNRFDVGLEDGAEYSARVVLLATGIVDVLPQIEGSEQCYGKTVHHCPYCDGWEHRDEPIAVLGEGKAGADFAVELLGWTSDIVFCTNGSDLAGEERICLRDARIDVRQEPITRLEREGRKLKGVLFEDGRFLERKALFFLSDQRPHDDLARTLGCKITEDGSICCTSGVCTSVEGVYAAGNTTTGLQLAIVAAAEGAKAAWAMNQALLANARKPPQEELLQVGE